MGISRRVGEGVLQKLPSLWNMDIKCRGGGSGSDSGRGSLRNSHLL